jgi:hypothetical protein
MKKKLNFNLKSLIFFVKDDQIKVVKIKILFKTILSNI